MRLFPSKAEIKSRIVELIRRYRKVAGISAREFDTRLGKGPQWLDRRKRYPFDVADLVVVLETLKVSPIRFMAELFEDVPASRAAAWRWAERGYESFELVAAGRALLVELDGLRYSRAAEVVAELQQLVHEIAPSLLPELLGVWGSAYRMLHNHDTAERFLQQGLSYADEVVDHVTAGRMHQRLSMVCWNRPDYRGALEHNEHARARHEAGENPVGVAQTLVDRGIFLGSQGRFERSTAVFLRALEGLPKTETKNRAAALHGIAHNYLETALVREALPYLEQVTALDSSPRTAAKQAWLYGRALSKAGHHAEAREQLSDAVERLMLFSPPEAALAHIDLAKALIRAGQPKEAYQRARQMVKFEHLFGCTTVARAAIIHLSNVGWYGKGLTAALDDAREAVSLAVEAIQASFNDSPLGSMYGP